MAWKRSSVRIRYAPPYKCPKSSGIFCLTGTIYVMTKTVRRAATAKKSRKQKKSTAAASSRKITAELIRNKPFQWGLLGVAAIAFISTGALWYEKVYTAPSNVFWGMINHSLATPGLTRNVLQTEGEAKSIEYTRFNFTASPTAQLGRTITNETGTVVTEGLGTTNDDFQRFVRVERPNEGPDAPNYNAVLNTWVRINDTGEANQPKAAPSILLRSLLGPVLTGNLQPEQRRELVRFIEENNVYKMDFDKATKKSQAGHSVVVVEGTLQLQPYAQALSKFAKYMGLPGRETIDAQQYSPTDSLKIQFIIDERSRQILAIDYLDQNISEEYDGHGISSQVDAPEKSINATEFQNKLQGPVQQ